MDCRNKFAEQDKKRKEDKRDNCECLKCGNNLSLMDNISLNDLKEFNMIDDEDNEDYENNEDNENNELDDSFDYKKENEILDDINEKLDNNEYIDDDELEVFIKGVERNDEFDVINEGFNDFIEKGKTEDSEYYDEKIKKKYEEMNNILKQQKKDKINKYKHLLENIDKFNNKDIDPKIKDIIFKFIKDFKKSNGETKFVRCLRCRIKLSLIDARRRLTDKRKEWSRKYEQLESTKKRRKIWDSLNPDKRVETDRRFKINRVKRLGKDEVLRQNNEQMKKWRNENPDKVKDINLKGRCNVNKKLYNCKYYSFKKNIDWKLSDEYAKKLFEYNECIYCRRKRYEYELNGIDRVDSMKSYTVDNCIPCCKICNYIKCDYSMECFIEHIKNILIHNNYIKGEQTREHCIIPC